MLKIDQTLTAPDLRPALGRFWQLSGEKIRLIEKKFDPTRGAPVFTAAGAYTARGWTEWTQGFQYGSAILQFDATGDAEFLRLGRANTVARMAPHVSHTGVHDHGFNNVSTYGNLRRLMREQRIPHNEWELNFYELALKISGAVQAARWTEHARGGFIYSFNGPHSLFVDTIRSCRALALGHALGHSLCGEGDRRSSLLERALAHIRSTAEFSVYYGEGRDIYDVRGRVAHECVFNTNDGVFRCPNSQQGYTGFSTWTRGLAWALLGFAEELDFFAARPDAELKTLGGRRAIETLMLKAATATADFYIANTPTDGVPYWDTGAPGLIHLGDYLDEAADPFNDHEPVDSSAAAIAAQGLLRLGHFLDARGQKKSGARYWQAGLTVFRTLLGEPYLSTQKSHQGLVLHSIYHRPNGWDYVPPGARSPHGESSMWGDYHARECALYLERVIANGPYHTFFS
jgi:unsaturated chondroitin disaccharide hydrolase